MYLVKRIDGSYIPHDDFDYQKSAKIKVGSVIETKEARRNYKFHKKAFALLHTGYINQDKYQSFEIYRKVMTILAGFYDQVPSKRGTEFIPQSLSYDQMSADRFDEYYEAMTKVVADDMGVSVDQLENDLTLNTKEIKQRF